MNRQEAEKLVGSRVQAWTSNNGVYVGVLTEVLPRRPWRGRVRIDGVLTPVSFEFGRPLRRGFRRGETIEIGGCHVSPTVEEGVSYADALRARIVQLEGWLANPSPAYDPYRGVYEAALRQYRPALEKETA